MTVEEADGMLGELATEGQPRASQGPAKGHLDGRVRGGGIFYRLW